MDRLKRPRPRHLASAIASRGTSSPGRTRRAWISSSRSATRRSGQDCPDLGGQYVTGAWPLPDPRTVHGFGDRADHASQRALRDDPAPDRDLYQPALSLARSHGAQGAPRRDRRHDTPVPLRGTQMQVGINGMGRIGRLALRAAFGGITASGERSARRQPSRCRPRQRTQGRHRGDGASARIRQHPRPLARSSSASRTTAPSPWASRRIGFSERRCARRRSPGAISAATSCWNAPASSSSRISCRAISTAASNA